MAPQITRLALCFGVLIVGFLVLRGQTVPANFGENGWYRKEAPQILAGGVPAHAGRDACKTCHEDKSKRTPHFLSGVGCETCHGASQAHVDDFDKFKPLKPTSRDFCTRCHGAITGRPATFPQINSKTHNPAQRCIECHTIHPAEDEK
jgi:hypothetical protein